LLQVLRTVCGTLSPSTAVQHFRQLNGGEADLEFATTAALSPKEKRVFGYLALPVLIGDEVVAAIAILPWCSTPTGCYWRVCRSSRAPTACADRQRSQPGRHAQARCRAPQGLAAASRARRLSAIRQLFKFLLGMQPRLVPREPIK